MLKGLIVLLGFFLLGEGAAALFGLPIPGSVLGMLLLFIALVLFRRVPESLRLSAHALLPYLPLFIVPASVGILNFSELLYKEGWSLLLAMTISLVIAIPLTGLVMQGLMSLFNKNREG